jgi:ParB/RepB/Spo0J family partition protein
MDTREFSKNVKLIPTHQIKPSPENPRGVVSEDGSFERLVSSIAEVGILVPIVVRELGPERFQLVDGERRYMAARKLRVSRVPAHVLSGAVEKRDLRKWMFHLHMTREQWGPLAQCKSLSEMYPQVERGLALAEKQDWAKKIAQETWMNARTARDRVHVLAWSRPLKARIYEFDAKEPDRDIYSYILAIEASIVEPSAKVFVDFYNHGKPVDRRANEVRASLFDKTINGIEVGLVTSRDQIRSVEPLFQADLSQVQQKVAVKIFADLVDKPKFSFDDAAAQVETQLPELLAERPPKPQRLIGSVRSLAETLRTYKAEYVDGIKPDSARKRLKQDLSSALVDLTQAARALKDAIN